MQKGARTALWFIACALALPFVLYALSPMVLSWLVEQELTNRGAERVRVELGYPGWRSTRLNLLSLKRDIMGSSWGIRVNHAELEYRIPQVLSGVFTRVRLPSASVRIGPGSDPSSQPAATDQPKGLWEVLKGSAIGVGVMTQPMPALPFEELTAEHVSISHAQAPSALQEVFASGRLRSRNGTVAGTFTFEGRQAPPYALSLVAKSIGDMSLTLQSSAASSPAVINLTSTLSRSESEVHVQGSLQTDIRELSTFLALFQPLGDVQESHGTLTVDWRGSTPDTLSIGSIVTDSSAAIGGNFRLEVETPQLAPSFRDVSLLVSGDFSARAGRLAWSLSGGSAASASIELTDLSLPPHISSLLPRTRQGASINLARATNGQVSWQDGRPRVSVEGTIEARYGTRETPLELTLSVSDPRGELAYPGSSQADFTLSGRWRGTQAEASPLGDAQLDLAGQISLESDHIQLVLARNSLLHALTVEAGATRVPQAQVTLTKQMTVLYRPQTGLWQAGPAFLRIGVPEVHWGEQTFSLEETSLKLERLRGGPAAWNAQGEVLLSGLSTRVSDVRPLTTNWKLDFLANSSEVLIDLLGRSLEGSLSARGRLQQNFSTQEGSLQLRILPTTFTAPSFILSKLLTPWKYPFDVASGKVSALGNASWTLNRGPSASAVAVNHADATLVLDGLAGHYKDFIFTDLSTSMSLTGAERWSMPKPATLTLGQLQSGLDVRRIALTFQIRPKPSSSSYAVDVRDFACSLLGGQALSDNIELEIPLTQVPLTLELKHLDLAEILALEQQEGLSGTGLLDGTLPLRISSAGLEVHQGKLEALPPGGHIRFLPAEDTARALSRTSPNMSVVLRALSNFHYRVLKVVADYRTDGTLTLQVRLEGSNPDFKGGKPIHFNLNIEENVLALIKTLRVIRGIEEDIERLYQK